MTRLSILNLVTLTSGYLGQCFLIRFRHIIARIYLLPWGLIGILTLKTVQMGILTDAGDPAGHPY